MKHILMTAVLAAATMTPALAQDGPPLPMPQEKPAMTGSKPLTPLKVQFVLSRFQGEKKISNLPYTLGVLANGNRTSMRMGINVPVTTTMYTSNTKTDTGATTPVTSYQYRDVGTNIDCSASDIGGGQYSLTITVEDSSIQTETGNQATRATARDIPIFRRFNASFSMLLRDGQTMQYVSVTDPLSGEVMRIDVTLALAK